MTMVRVLSYNKMAQLRKKRNEHIFHIIRGTNNSEPLLAKKIRGSVDRFILFYFRTRVDREL
jgi:hypothetical protein